MTGETAHRRVHLRQRPLRRSLLLALGFAALTTPLALFAQSLPSKLQRIGIVEFGAPPDGRFAANYLAALKRLGYDEARTVQIERRYAQGDSARIGELLRELAAAKVDLVFTVGNDIAQIAKQVAPALPVVTAGSEDPVMSGLIEDYRRPGGNVTGVTYLSPQLAAKRLELLKEMLPALSRVAVLQDPGHFDTYYRDMQPVAQALAIRMQPFDVTNAKEIEAAFAAAEKARAEALFIVPSRLIVLQAKRIIELAQKARLPVMSPYANFTEIGGLISYGAVASEMLQRAAAQTDKILKGAKAGDVPFERAAAFELVVNMKTANALGIKIPPSVLLRVDRRID